MSNYIINKILNKNNAYYVMAIMFVFICYLIFEHLFHLTSLVIQYNAAVDYGKFMQKICQKEYFESETSRFELASTSESLKLSNDKNKTNYLTMILVIAIIVSLLISFIFTWLVFNTFLNRKFIFEILGKEDDEFLNKLNITDSFVQNIKNLFMYVLYALYHVFLEWIRNIYILIKQLFITRVNDASIFKNLMLFITIVIVYVIVYALMVLMPTYIGLKLSDQTDISPFNLDLNIYVPYIVLFAILVIFRFAYTIFRYTSEYDQVYDPLTEYFHTNVENLYTTNSTSGYIVYFTFLAIYICSFYILGNIINIYKRETSPFKYTEKEDSKDTINVNIQTNIEDVFLNNVYGYKELSNYELQYIFLNNISGVSFTIFIILCAMVVVWIFCSVYGDGSRHNIDLIKYGIIVPLMILLTVIVLTNTISEFNSLINKYVIEEPTKLYKEYLNIINKIFNQLLQIEYSDIDNLSSGFVCRNVGNAIILTLYSKLFKGVQNISRTGEAGGTTIDLTPKFIYERSCDETMPVSFDKEAAYKIKYYINSKTFKKNIFYKFHNCSSLNHRVLQTISDNIGEVLNYDDTIDVMQEINKQLYNSVTKTNDPISYIKYEIIMKNDVYKQKLKDYTNTLKRQLHESIYNATSNRTYHTREGIVYFDQTTKKFYKNNEVSDMNEDEVFDYNNKLSDELNEAIESHMLQKYANLVSDIANIYTELLCANLYVFTPIYIKSVDAPNFLNENIDAMLEDYVRLLIEHIDRTFSKINSTLSTSISKIKDKTLSKYIITNYNAVNVDKLYTKNMLEHITPNKSQIATSIEINKSAKQYNVFLTQLIQVYKILRDLHVDVRNGNFSNITFLSQLQDSKATLQKLITDFKKFENDKAFKDNINSFYRNTENQYTLSYETIDVDNMNEKKIVDVADNMYDVTTNMLRLCLTIVLEIEKIYNFFSKKIYSAADLDIKKAYMNNVDIYMNVVVKNINSMNNDHVNYENMAKYVVNVREFDYESSELNRDVSNNILANAKKTDSMVYILVLNYIISIILTNLIIV